MITLDNTDFSNSRTILVARRFLPFLFLLAFSVLYAGSANAGLCVVGEVKEVGRWSNPDNDTRGVTRAIFKEECKDDSEQVCNGNSCTITHGVKLVYTARLWGKCHPADCDWGTVEGDYHSSGWLRFRYDPGFARRVVWGQVWSGSDNWLRLIIDTDFVSASREDYRFDAWMRRQ